MADAGMNQHSGRSDISRQSDGLLLRAVDKDWADNAKIRSSDQPVDGVVPKAKDSAVRRRDVTTAIIDAAEVVFANLGFDGTTTRAIAEEANVNLATIHYHFSTKENLFELVVARRASQVNGRRRELLAEATKASPEHRLEAVLDALMRPTLELGGTDPQTANHYGRLVAQLASGTDERSIRLTSENFDQIALEFIDAIELAVPHLGRALAARAYLNAISVGMLMIARTGRVTRLSGGLSSEEADEEAIQSVVRYLAAGTRALVSQR